MAKPKRFSNIKHVPEHLKLRTALKITGFVLCEFKSDGNDECECCNSSIKNGQDVYYDRTCYEVDEGSYYCKPCTILMPKIMQREADSWANYHQAA